MTQVPYRSNELVEPDLFYFILFFLSILPLTTTAANTISTASKPMQSSRTHKGWMDTHPDWHHHQHPQTTHHQSWTQSFLLLDPSQTRGRVAETYREHQTKRSKKRKKVASLNEFLPSPTRRESIYFFLIIIFDKQAPHNTTYSAHASSPKVSPQTRYRYFAQVLTCNCN